MHILALLGQVHADLGQLRRVSVVGMALYGGWIELQESERLRVELTPVMDTAAGHRSAEVAGLTAL